MIFAGPGRDEDFGLVNNLVAFVRDGLLDPRATKQALCGLAPAAVASGFTTMRFEECPWRK